MIIIICMGLFFSGMVTLIFKFISSCIIFNRLCECYNFLTYAINGFLLCLCVSFCVARVVLFVCLHGVFILLIFVNNSTWP